MKIFHCGPSMFFVKYTFPEYRQWQQRVTYGIDTDYNTRNQIIMC